MSTIHSVDKVDNPYESEKIIDPRAVDRCTYCILPHSTRGLSFDEEGVCDICIMQKELRKTAGDVEEGRGDVERTIEKIRELGIGKKYDCLVGLSGGRDSSYLLYQLVRVHKLRCMAAYYRTPFTSEVIEENVQRIITHLDVPLVRMNISRKFHQQYSRKVLLLWKKIPCPELINLLCAPCKYLNGQVFKIARDYNIKSIVFGGNKYETFQLGAASFTTRHGKHVHSFGSQVRRALLILKRGITFLLNHPGCIPLIPVGFKASILYINPHTPYLRIRYPDIMRIDYFHHTEYNETECTKVVTSEMDWRLPPGCNSYWRADCSMAELKNLLFHQTVGVSYLDAYLSNMVRLGIITRDQALKRLETEGKVSQDRLAQALDSLGLSGNFMQF